MLVRLWSIRHSSTLLINGHNNNVQLLLRVYDKVFTMMKIFFRIKHEINTSKVASFIQSGSDFSGSIENLHYAMFDKKHFVTLAATFYDDLITQVNLKVEICD